MITDFNSGMDASVKPLNSLMQKGGMRTLSDIVARRDDLKTVQTALNDMGTALKEQQGKADAARAQLKQPDDLKAVYAKAYEKTVTLPADTFRSVLPQINATFDSSLKIADYVAQHQKEIQISGSTVQVSDPAVQKELNTMLQDLNTQARNVQQAHTRLQAVMLGR